VNAPERFAYYPNATAVPEEEFPAAAHVIGCRTFSEKSVRAAARAGMIPPEERFSETRLMAQVHGLLHYLRGFVRRGGFDETDRQLLQRFAVRHDEAAFAALVERHGGLVWGACRRLLRHEQDAEDAFQTAFLVLARKAGTISWRDDVGNWLYAVTLRVARRAQARALRRRLREQEAAAMPAREASDEAGRAELAAVVDEEVGRLPDKYRRPVVLCCLQGKTYGEAARLLGWPEGTVSGRLARARELLQRRLTRRGLAVSGAALAALLAPEAGSAGAPAALVSRTITASLAFAAGRGEVAGPAAALAEGVLQTMSLTRLKTSVLILLALAVVGTGIGVFVYADQPDAPAPPPRPEAAQPAAKQGKPAQVPLPREWAGRWVANPFAGATAIEVFHAHGGGGGGDTYLIENADALAALLKEVKVIAVQNGITPSCKPPSRLRIRYRDGRTFEAGLLPGDGLTAHEGMVQLDPRFFAALNRRLSEQAKRPVDVLKMLPEMPRPAAPAEVRRGEVKPSRRSLTAGFTSLGVFYSLGGQGHFAQITEARALEVIHKALHILKDQPCTDEKPQSRTVQLWSKDGSLFYAQILSATEFFDFTAGRFTVRPDFFKALSREVSRLAGQKIDVCKDNPLTQRQARRVEEFRKLLTEVKAFRLTPGGDRGGDLLIKEPDEVDRLVKGLRWVQPPAQEYKLARAELVAELITKAGKKVAVHRLNVQPRPAEWTGPALADLVEVEGFGQLWVDNSWRQKFSELVMMRDLAAKGRRTDETAALVGRDLPAFWKHVISITAHYREREKVMHITLPVDDSRPVVELLATAKLEKLDWSVERWDREIKRYYDRGAGSLDLAPGLGFSLEIVVSGERELLIPPVGRLTFVRSPLPALREAIDAKRANDVELLPQPK
jgi:RNA polymerase sigma factor (sigma-70 family)